uniref:(northern house mosquito) hypothetical protein n=1 Tax=Culex pipiens TaxID=7175 RepID=A0A8D8D182_CULPI
MHKRVVWLSAVAHVTAKLEPALTTVIVETPVAQSFFSHQLQTFSILQLLEVSAVTWAMLRAVAQLTRCHPSLIASTSFRIFFFSMTAPCSGPRLLIFRELFTRQVVKCDVRFTGFFNYFRDEISERP